MIDKESFKLTNGNLFKWLKFKLNFARNNPNFFYPCGLTVFCGPQGSGKTLSAVRYTISLLNKYPDCMLVTNLDLKEFPIDYKRVFPFFDNDDFAKYSNGHSGVIFLIDEIQLYLNSLQSKNVNLDVVAQISQQRKQRKHIVCTSQVFGRLAKPLREQFDSVIVCNNVLGFLQINKLIDRNSLEGDDSTGTNITGQVKARSIWVHSPAFYDLYDTYSVVQRGVFASGENMLKEV